MTTERIPELLPEQILATLDLDQRRMVFRGKIDSGGSGSLTWSHVFGEDRRIWQRTTTNPEPHLTRLGRRVYYSLITDPQAVAAIKECIPSVGSQS